MFNGKVERAGTNGVSGGTVLATNSVDSKRFDGQVLGYRVAAYRELYFKNFPNRVLLSTKQGSSTWYELRSIIGT